MISLLLLLLQVQVSVDNDTEYHDLISAGAGETSFSATVECPEAYDGTTCVPHAPNAAYSGVVLLLAQMLPGEWAMIPGSEQDPSILATSGIEFPFCSSIRCDRDPMLNWASAVLDEAGGKIYIPAGGGHKDRGGGELYEYDLLTSTHQRLSDPVPLVDDGSTCPLPVSGPPGMHQYDGVEWVDSVGGLIYTGTTPYCKNGTLYGKKTWTWTGGVWSYLGGIFPEGGTAKVGTKNAYDADLDRIINVGKNYFYVYDVDDGAYTQVFSEYSNTQTSEGTIDVDLVNRYVWWTSETGPTLRRRSIPLTGEVGPKEHVIDSTLDLGRTMRVNPLSGNLLFWDGDEVTRFYPADSTYEVVSVGQDPPGSTNAGTLTYGKFRCLSVPMVDSQGMNVSPNGTCIGFVHPADGIWVFKVP